MKISSTNRTILGLSLGILAGIAIILIPGILAVAQSPVAPSVANGGHANNYSNNNGNNSQHSTNPSSGANNSTTRTSQTNSTTYTVTPSASAGNNNTSTINNNTGQNSQNTQPSKPAPGNVPATRLLPLGEQRITLFTLTVLISTLVVPALGLSFIMRNWSVVRAKKYERSL